MARDPPLLASSAPTLRAPATVTIGHVQLRDVIICPRERGIVNYVQGRSIVEKNLLEPGKPRTLAELSFVPNTLASLPVPNTDHTLLAAGGQDAEIYLSLLTPENKSTWQCMTHLEGSINNSILLTSLSLTDSHQNSAEPRMAVSNNDRVVMFFDVPIRSRPPAISPVGAVRFNVPVNHSSISPDGRTLLSVGDSSKVFLHRLTGGARVTATPIATLTLPPTPNPFSSPALVASFSTAFSADGSKYAVASQEGAVAVWDVRSTKPLRVFHTDKTRGSARTGDSTTWLSEDPQEWSHRKSRGPGWSARNVKFGGRPGRELMLFTEHTSLIHVIDARTFETEEILHMPAFPTPSPNPPPPPRQRPSAPAVAATAPTAHPPSSAYATSRMVRTLEDTFRIAAADDDDVLYIPPLGDRAVEREVRRVLGHHGVPTRFRIEEEDDAEMEEVVTGDDAQEEQEDCVVPAPPPSREEEAADLDAERNLAGACFDPTGSYVYVASDAGVAEWGVRGAEKRWWVDGAW
ncbi:WD40-repeat-containing domain protein, partial [Mycena filopes]